MDSNDGTVGGNSSNPANIASYLRAMRRVAHPILKNWNRNMGPIDRPYYLLQSDLFDALREYYESIGTDCCKGMDILVNGETIPGMMMFEGSYVLDMGDWSIFDNTSGAILADGKSKHQRAVYIAPQVLTGLANARNLDNGFNAALQVERSPVMQIRVGRMRGRVCLLDLGWCIMILWWRDGARRMCILIEGILSNTNFQLRITAVLDAILSAVPPQPRAVLEAPPHRVVDAAALRKVSGRYRFSALAELDLKVEDGRLLGQAVGERKIFGIPKENAVELVPTETGDYVVPGRYPTLLRFTVAEV